MVYTTGFGYVTVDWFVVFIFLFKCSFCFHVLKLVAMNTTWSNMVCGRFGGVDMNPTRWVGDFEDQLGVEGAAQGKLAEDFWKLCHLCQREQLEEGRGSNQR